LTRPCGALEIFRFPVQQMLELAVNQAHLNGSLVWLRARFDAL
jgi:hypothetical protein